MTRRFLISLAAFIGLVLIGFVATTRAQPRYTLTHLRGIGAVTMAYGINDAGIAVGASSALPGGVVFPFNNSSQALMWGTDGNPVNLGRLPGQPATQGAGALDINNNGEVVGWALQPFMTTTFMYAVRFSGGTASLLRSDLGAPSIAYRINDGGQIIGRTNANGPFLLSGGSVTFLKSPNANSSIANDINNAGRIVGFESIGTGAVQPIEFRPGQSAVAFTVSTGDGGTAEAINESAQVVGQWAVRPLELFNRQFRAAEFLATGPLSLAPIGSDVSRSALAINEIGQTVGWSRAANGVTTANIFEQGQAISLQSLIEPNPQWELSVATDINNLGQIIGYGRFDHDNIPSTPTQVAAWRLDPIPEPVAFAGVAAAILFLRRRNRPA